jgi:hypothetical protein
VTLKSPREFGNMLFPKASSRVDGRQCAARHRLRSRKGSPGQHAGKNSTCRSPEPIWGTREWSFRHGTARLLEGLSQAVACLLSGPAIPCDLGSGKRSDFTKINRKIGNRIKYCKLDAVTGKPISGAPPPITNERLQTGRTRGPVRRADRALKWQKQEQDAPDRKPNVTRTRTSSATVLKRRWKSGWKKPFPRPMQLLSLNPSQREQEE